MLTPQEVRGRFPSRWGGTPQEEDARWILAQIFPLSHRKGFLEPVEYCYDVVRAKDIHTGRYVDEKPLSLCNCEIRVFREGSDDEFISKPFYVDDDPLLPQWNEKDLGEIRSFYALEAQRCILQGYSYTAEMFWNYVCVLRWILGLPDVPFSQVPDFLGIHTGGLGSETGVAPESVPSPDDDEFIPLEDEWDEIPELPSGSGLI